MIFVLILTILVCTIIYIRNTEITFLEYLGMFSALFIIEMLIYFSPLMVPNSFYFVSGRIMNASYHPKWVEEYEQMHQSCTSDGKHESCRVYYTTEHHTHQEHWEVLDSLGNDWEVSKSFFDEVRIAFGRPKPSLESQSSCCGGHRVSGDRTLYSYDNASNTYAYPVSQTHTWRNPLIGTQSIFYRKSDTKIPYPTSDGRFSNNRMMKHPDLNISQKDWDILNTKLYESVGANAILVFREDIKDCTLLENNWISGGKNDVILCIVGSPKKPKFVRAFGWSSNLFGLRSLESYVLIHGVSKDNMNDLTLKFVAAYHPTDFSKYSYLRLPIPIWIKVIMVVVALMIGMFLYHYFSTNEYSK